MIRMMGTANGHAVNNSLECSIAPKRDMAIFFSGIPPGETIVEITAVGVKTHGKLIAVTVIKPVVIDTKIPETDAFCISFPGNGIAECKKRMDIPQHITAASDIHAGKHIGNTHVGQCVVVSFQ